MWLEFELAYYDIAVPHFSLYAPGILHVLFRIYFKWKVSIVKNAFFFNGTAIYDFIFFQMLKCASST